jgi:hypothetical protein
LYPKRLGQQHWLAICEQSNTHIPNLAKYCQDFRLRPAVAEAKMDDYMFKLHVNECRTVEESTTYVEMFNYTVSVIRSRDGRFRN